MTTPYDNLFDRATQNVTSHVPEPQRDQVLAQLADARTRANEAWARHEDLHNQAHEMGRNVGEDFASWRQHALDMMSHWSVPHFASPGGGGTGAPPQGATSVSNTGQMSTTRQRTGSTGSVSENIVRRVRGA